MPDEDGFLAAIRQTPADDTARLVYADWLDEQDDGASKLKSEFIRLELRLANEPVDDYTTPTIRLQQLAVELDSDWLVLLSRPQIEGCTVWTERNCPSIWSRLTPTPEPNVRTCAECHKAVHYARTLNEAQEYARRGFCAAATPALHRRPGGLTTWRLPTLPVVEHEPLLERPRLRNEPDERLARNERLRAEATRNEAAIADAPPSANKRQPPPARRQKGRGRNRNIQLDDWEGTDE
jgi:uncharacterized protein (TIGR02996 family)